MHSLDEPLDLKLSLSKLRAAREKGGRTLLGASSTKCRAPWTPEDGAVPATAGSPGSPPPPLDSLPPPSQCHDKRDASFSSPPTIHLSLSPPSATLDSPRGGRTSLSPDSLSSGELVSASTLRELQSLRYIEGLRSSFQFFLPLNAGGPLQLPSAAFLSPTKEKRLSPELPLPKQLLCRWAKCNQRFDLLQDLVDHVNDFHVKPEKESGYCCHWEGCARHGRGFNARYKMLIHIRTHTNEKPHRCPTCNKSFSRLENLKIHNRSHTGEKPYLCPYEGCSKRYSNSSDRFKHTRTHYVDKPYHCKMPGCHKRYTDPSSLRKHIKAHGHFIAQHHRELLTLQTAGKPTLAATATAAMAAADVPSYLHATQLLLPGPAATLFGSHGLPGVPFTTPGALDLSILAGGLGTAGIAGLPSPVLAPLDLAKSPLLSSTFAAAGRLGLPLVSLLAGTSAKGNSQRGLGGGLRTTKAGSSGGGGNLHAPGPLEGCKESRERTELSWLRPTAETLSLLPGGVLDLSMGVNSAGSPSEPGPPSWVVIPTSSLLLKQAVVN